MSQSVRILGRTSFVNFRKFLFVSLMCVVTIFSLSGCATKSVSVSQRMEWVYPKAPIERKINVKVIKAGEIAKEDGILLNKSDAVNLLKNKVAQESYVKKLEILVNTMVQYYGASFSVEK